MALNWRTAGRWMMETTAMIALIGATARQHAFEGRALFHAEAIQSCLDWAEMARREPQATFFKRLRTSPCPTIVDIRYVPLFAASRFSPHHAPKPDSKNQA